jgi:hypothetical protein
MQQLKSNKRGQIFLVCTVVMIIYMLSFINILYELNLNQFTQSADTAEFEATFDNFRVETDQIIKGLLANYSQPGSVITTNSTAAQILDEWLTFSEKQVLKHGYIGIFEIDEIIPVSLPIELVKANGYLSIRCNIDVYMECSYSSIEIQLQYFYYYALEYTNTATNALIDFYYNDTTITNYIGYAEVTVNALPTTSLFNGTYIHSAPLVATDTIEGITQEQIIVSLTI